MNSKLSFTNHLSLMVVVTGGHNHLWYVTDVVTKFLYFVVTDVKVSDVPTNTNHSLPEPFFRLQVETKKLDAIYG